MKTTPWKFTALGLSALLAGTTAAADDRVLGTVIGAGVGAVIGHQVGGNQGAEDMARIAAIRVQLGLSGGGDGDIVDRKLKEASAVEASQIEVA